MWESGSETVDKYILVKIHYKYSNMKNWLKDKYWKLNFYEAKSEMKLAICDFNCDLRHNHAGKYVEKG